MRIGIDARPLSLRRAGVGNYVYGLVEQLPCLAPEHDYFLYANRALDRPPAAGSIHERIDHKFGWCPGSFWLRGRAGQLVRKDHVDVFWATHPLLPRWLPSKTIKIITVYDLAWLRFPHTTAYYPLMVQRIWTRKAVREADLIVTISRSTTEDLVEGLGVPETKIRHVYPGVSDRYKPHDQRTSASFIAKKYGVPARYLAAVGTVEPRKNLNVLVDVLRLLKNRGRLECPLLVAGAAGWKSSPLHRKIVDAGLSETEMRFLGYIPDEDLPFFYSGAEAFLFPSLYEGFGIPPVEAMACGTPVVASTAKCMPEVLGEAAILKSPTDPEGFASAILRLREDEELSRSLRAAGIRRAHQFCWQKSAKQLLELVAGPSSQGQTGEVHASARLEAVPVE